tara:strand:+ start:767 stop:1333 length:567 start_codon:yes stop_codon:yes gene_type:complete
MKLSKSFLRKKSLLKRKKKSLSSKGFNFKLIFNLIKKNFNNKKIVIAGYYPSNFEVNILNFLKEASDKKFKIVLPVTETSNKMSFKPWVYNEPLYVGKFGILEPKNSNKNIIPDLTLVPLVAFDNKLNRIGYGKGYYDRILKKINKVKKKTVFLGIAYYFQKCKSIPVNKHDFKLDYIFTERGIISSN